MSECEFLEKCPIFQKYKDEWIPEDWIVSKYCKGRHDKCKRKEIRLTGAVPSPSMLPNGTFLDN